MKYKYDIYITKIQPNTGNLYEAVRCIFPNTSDTFEEAVRNGEAKKEEVLKIFKDMPDWDEKWEDRFDIRITPLAELTE